MVWPKDLSSRIWVHASTPSISGIITSSKIKSGKSFLAKATPSFPLLAVWTSYPSFTKLYSMKSDVWFVVHKRMLFSHGSKFILGMFS